MKETVVYLSSEQLVVVSAESKRDALRIEDYFTLPFHLGAMINGVIINEDVIKEQIQEVVHRGIHNVHLVIDSGQILAKNVVIPKLKNKEIYQFVKDELTPLLKNEEDMVYDYSFLEEDASAKGASQIFALGAERRLIDTYVQLFEECQVHVQTIDYTANALIRMVRYLPGLIDKTYIIAQFDGNNMIATVFTDNQYSLSYRARIMAKKETMEYNNEVVNNLSRLIQSHNRSGATTRISEVIVFGLEHEYEVALCQTISELLSVQGKRMPQSKLIYNASSSKEEPFELSQYIYPVSVFFRKTGKGIKNKDIDLIAASTLKQEPSKLEQWYKYAIAPILIVLCIAIPYIYLSFNNNHLQENIDQTQASIDKYNLAIAATDQSAYEQLQSMQSVLTSLEKLDQQLKSVPIVHSSSIQLIQKTLLNGMEIENMKYIRETSTLTVGISSKNVQNIEKYVKLVKAQGVFADVTYNAYNEAKTTTASSVIDPLTGLPIGMPIESSAYKTTLTITLK